MSLLYTNKVESQKKGEGDPISWQTYAVEKFAVLESVIQDMVQQEEEEDQPPPNQLLEVANAILETSSCIHVNYTYPSF
jgi:hypothetical protein